MAYRGVFSENINFLAHQLPRKNVKNFSRFLFFEILSHEKILTFFLGSWWIRRLKFSGFTLLYAKIKPSKFQLSSSTDSSKISHFSRVGWFNSSPPPVYHAHAACSYGEYKSSTERTEPLGRPAASGINVPATTARNEPELEQNQSTRQTIYRILLKYIHAPEITVNEWTEYKKLTLMISEFRIKIFYLSKNKLVEMNL